ncbi:MAG: bifunctional helix-turn-helix transcriptional regulator/GNAT family N-acetyltransferase [Gemmatimonadota bacterium]|nr:bifunctional helix-turn-helix transcriptional regulator/GNAT family N-acetyltransferase [Gemmatimonadota bacterium]
MPDPRLDARIAAVRKFNRFYTRQIGVLEEGLLKSDLSLAEVRVLYELAQEDGVTATSISHAVGLDAGYLSRMLRSFERRGLIQRRRSAVDARRTLLSLTRKGRGAFAKLDALAHDEIAALLAPHPTASQRALVGAMHAIEHILGERTPAPTPTPTVLRQPAPGDFGWVIERHGELYADEYGWGNHFEALVVQIVADFAREHDPARERFWIALADGERVGSVLLVRESESVARMRLLLVEPSARGLGVGKTLVRACLDFARSAGYAKVTLWTNAVLHAARAIYIANGFDLVREEMHTHFGSEQLGQDWELVL